MQIFKPLVDTRFSEDHVVSHSDMRIASETVKSSDEAQFFDARLPAVCNTLADRGTRVIVASSDLVLVGATGLHEARCRHCFDPRLAADETADEKSS